MSGSMSERRRQGPVNNLRRQLYGLILLSSSLAAEAADAPPETPSMLPRLPAVEVSRQPWADRDALLVRHPNGSGWLAYGGLNALNQHARLISPDYAYVPVGDLLFTAHFLGDDLATLRKGLGVDLAVPAIGYFHLNLYSGRDGPNAGKRWRVQPDGIALPESSDRIWSLGGSLDLVRPDRNSHRQVIFVPQLVMNVDQVARVPGHMQMALSYRNWNSPVSGLLPDSGMVPQLTFRWSY
ncbi:MAG: hypothetical protein E6R07_01310 [Nevskiaceae bacterium]|nr:MAG: hypothetical protein E6R07_01310 [Nevskiaceae bacterium]